MCARSIGSSTHSTPSRAFSAWTRGSSSGNNNHHRKDPSTWKIAAVVSVVASGAYLDRLGATDNGGVGEENQTFGGINGPMVARMTKRRDTSLRISFGDSVLLDHVEPMSSKTVAGANDKNIVLLMPEDELTISPFLYYLMKQVQLVRVQEDEQDLYTRQYVVPIGLPGLGCVHCTCSSQKKVRSQVFPLDRRTFPNMVRKQLYNHILRCERCPPEVKLELKRLKKLEIGKKISREERIFFKKLWFRMGHKEVI